MTVVNMLEAKTNLSRLLAAAEHGDEVVIARHGIPAARLVPVTVPARVFGADKSIVLAEDSPFFDPLSEEELAAWE